MQAEIQKPGNPMQNPGKPNLANCIIEPDHLKPSQKDLDKALFEAINKSSYNEVKSLLENGANPNAVESKLKNTPLMEAICPHIRDRMKIVELLVLHGADINIQRKDGKFTALMMAGQMGDDAICKFLLEHGADPNAKKDYGTTALMMSTRNERVCEMMIKHGAKVNTKDNDNDTPLMDAALRGDHLSCAILIKHGAEINARDDLGRTALMLAAHGGHLEACRVLLAYGANYLLKNTYDGKTAYEMAKETGKDEKTIKLLFAPISLTDLFGRKTKKFRSLFDACASGGV